jgi:hypothetical protein
VSSDDAADAAGTKTPAPGKDGYKRESVLPESPYDSDDIQSKEAPPAVQQQTRSVDNGDKGDKGGKEEIAALKQEIARMKAAEAAQDVRLDELELDAIEAATEEKLTEPFRLFGFSDIAIMWRHIGNSFVKEGDGFMNTSPQFLMQHLNLYFASQMTESLSFLTEVQFMFLPNAAQNPDVMGLGESDQMNTNMVDPYTQQKFRWGGVNIQRAWLKWEPFEFLGVKAGYFLTPYGIWHEDHASTVRISILPPFEIDTNTPPDIVGKKPIPNGQLGFQLYGRVFPHDNLRFDYAFTISNGRGSADTVIDYDDNKGLGLRLKLTYSDSNVEVALGGYGYFGEYTDKIFAYWNEKVLENYKEYALSADFLVTFFGVRIQAEYLRNLTRYSDKGRLLEGRPGVSTILLPGDYLNNMFYAMLAYQLPLDRWLGGMTFTPYLGMELDKPNDLLETYRIFIFNFGLNFRPNSIVVLKLEGSRYYLVYQMESQTSTVWTVAGQLAVSF